MNEVLAAHDSALARWAERRNEPLRVWIQPVARLKDWSPTLLPLVRVAFVEWGETGIPLNFTFVFDSASANVHVTWVDRFREPISGKTLWTHDERCRAPTRKGTDRGRQFSCRRQPTHGPAERGLRRRRAGGKRR